MKQKLGRKLLSILLTLAMIVGLMPGMGLTAYAADDYSSIKNTTTVITFDGKEWYLIDYDSNTVTLLSKECVGASKFNENFQDGNTYSGSTVESFVNSWYTDNISTEAQGAVNGSGMFLLTKDQANALTTEVRKCSQASGASDNGWWLCSTGSKNYFVVCVDGDNGDVGSNGTSVKNPWGVRPALKLNLKSVIFSSDTKTFEVGSAAVAVTGVALNPSTAQTIDVDGTVSFTATVAPDNATDKTVKWSVSGTNADAVKLYSDQACTTEVGTDATETLTVYAKGISAGSATVTATSNADSTKSSSCAVTVNAAAAGWTGGTYTASADETIDGDVTVSEDATLTINSGVTLTVNGGIMAQGKTLTVAGAGTLVVNSTGGKDGVTGNVTVNGGTVTVTGGNGGNGKEVTQFESPGNGGKGGNGVTGDVTVKSGSITVTGGNGGNGGNAGTTSYSGGNGGNGGSGVDGDITVNSGSATVTGGSGGSGGTGRSNNGGAGSVGKAVTGTITGNAEESANNNTWTTVSGTSSTVRYIKVTAPLDPVAYMAWDEASKTVKAVEGGCASYTVVTDSTTTWSAGWYVVNGDVTINSKVQFSGDVNLILCDNATLTINGGNDEGIKSEPNKAGVLTVYAQSTGNSMGGLRVASTDNYGIMVGISGTNGGLTINGGNVSADGKNNGILVYGNLTINGGSVTAASNTNAIAVFSGNMTVNGGTVNATGANSDSETGGHGVYGAVTVNGGTVTATGGNASNSNKDGGKGVWGNVTVSGGTFTATGGIGGWQGGAGVNGNVTVSGGTVNVAGGNTTSDRDGGKGIAGNVTVTGGEVTATGGTRSSGYNKAIEGTIQGTAEESDNGTAWTAVSGNTSDKQYVKVYSAHTHSFAYAASGATITATCGNRDGCPLASNGYKATLTIAAPAHTNVGDGKSAEATITDANSIKGSATVSYYAATKSGTTYTKTGSALGSAPDAAGDYVAEITLEDKTAFVGYTISKTAQAAPTGFKSTPAATPYANGSINDGDPAINKTNLQVSSDGGKTWADVTQFPVSGKPGVYQFKYKETDALSESPVTSVLLEATNELREVKITSNQTDANIYKSDETNTLTAVTNTNVTNLTLEFAWYREGVTEAVGTGATYTLQAEDVGKKLTVVVTDKTTGATEPYTRVSTATPVIVTVAPTTYQITGNVKVPQSDGATTYNNVASASVELRQGNTVFATATTNNDGNYTFSSVPNGEYNIVVTDANGTTKTEYVKVENGNQTINVTMPFYKVSSKVDVKGETPAAVVAGLDDAAADSLTNDEKAGGVTTTMTMEIESTDDLTAKADDQLTDEQKQEKNEQQAIKAQNTGTDKSDALDFIDMSVYKRTQKDGESAQVEDVHNLNKVLEILLPYATANRSFNIFRYHGTAAAKFTQLSTRPTGSFTDGKFFVGDGFIAIYASGFSTYAIGYSDSTTPSTPASTPSHSGGNGGYTATLTVPVSGDSASVAVSASVSGSTATVKAPTTAQLDKVIGESVKTGEVTIDVSGLNRNIATVSIPTETVKAIEKAVSDPNNDADALTVKLTDGSVTFDAAALAAITDQAKGSTIQLNLDGIAESGLRTAQKTAIKDMDVQAVYDAYLTSNGQRISDFKGGKATVTVSYTLKDGQIGRGVVVWYVAEDGKTTEVSTTYTSKEVTFTVEHFSNYVIAYDEARAAVCPQDNTCPISAFTDADPTAWYHDGVHYALENGIMSGYGNGKFGPDDNTSRAMVAQILWNMEGRPVVNYAMSYTDVDSEAWYTEAVRWATSEKIMSGYGGGKFGPGDAMTREQLVTILYRYAKRKGVDVSVGEDTNILSYDDAFDISEWAIPAMQWAVGSGAVGGRTNTTLNSKDTATRAEIASIIMRYRTEIAK